MIVFAANLALLLTLAGSPGAPEPARASLPDARQAIDRAVPYLERGAVGWWETHSCITCHQMPIAFWSLHEAQARGIEVDAEKLNRLRTSVVEKLGERLAEGKKPHLAADDVPLLIHGLTAAKADEKTSRLLGKSVEHLLRYQREDGSWIDPSLHWKEKPGTGEVLDPYPPIIESDAVKTMWIVLAGERVRPDDPAWRRARDRALAWLKTGAATSEASGSPDSHQERMLRLLIAARFGEPADAKPLVARLLADQNEDGGWSQARGLPSDALATGQALYALASAPAATRTFQASGALSDAPAAHRAWAFLAKTQREDGSWFVPTRNKGKPQGNDDGDVTSYFGAGWAVIGLARTLPTE